jgi:hypothetical protein
MKIRKILKGFIIKTYLLNYIKIFCLTRKFDNCHFYGCSMTTACCYTEKIKLHHEFILRSYLICLNKKRCIKLLRRL